MMRRATDLVRAGTAASLAALAVVVVPFPTSGAQAAAPSDVSCGTSGTPAVVALQDRHFYVDSSGTVQLLSGYAGYSVKAGASARSNLWIGYSDFAGGVLSLAAQQSSAVAIPDLASGGSAAEYVLLTATGVTSTPQTHTVTLYDGPPGSGSAICSRTFTYSDVVDTIKALANKVTSVTASATPAQAKIGDAVSVTVVGHTGTLGAGPANDPGVLDYTPNALTDFPAAAWRLERTELTISPNGDAPEQTYVDRLYLSGASGPDRSYTARYTFRAVGPTDTTADLKPIQYIASGTQVKHTDQGGATLYALPAVSRTADVTVHKVVTSPSSGVLTSGGGVVSYRVTMTNDAGHASDLDWLGDTMPAGAQFVPDSLTIDGRPAANPVTNGRVLTVPGPLRVPASGQMTVDYSLNLDGTPGQRSNSAVGHYAGVIYDETPDVTDDQPASAPVSVLGDSPPDLVNDTASTPANTPVVVDVLSNDSAPSGLPLHVSVLGIPSTGTAVLSPDGTVTYTPAANRSGTATFTYTATDGYGSGTAKVTVTVAPVTARDLYATGKNTNLNAPSVLTNDACTSCTVSTTLVSPPATGTVSMHADGTFSYTPANNVTGNVTFSYRATDPATSLTADGTVNITVADLAPDYATTPNATAKAIPVQDNDPGCPTSSCRPQAGTAPSRGAVVYGTGQDHRVTYTPTGTLWGLDTFTYGITGSTGSATIPVTVLVGPPAKTASTTYSTAVDVPLPTNGSCSGCVYSLASPATHGAVSVDSSTGTATYQPATGYAGADSYTYQVKDAATGLQITGTVTVTIGPKAVNDTASVLLGNSVSGDVSANDWCSDTCTYTKLTDPASGTATLQSNGAWTYQPGSLIGDVSFSYRITSSISGSPSDTATVHVTVNGARDDSATTAADTAADIDVRTNDPCGTCVLSAVSRPSSGTASISNGMVHYVPAAGFTGRATFTYTLMQGNATTAADVTVTVLPDAQDDTAVTVLGAPVQLLPLANDTCSGCALTGVDAPTSGSATYSGNVATFTPAELGEATFAYHGTDIWGDDVTATVSVQVVSPLGLNDDSATTRSDTPATIDVLHNDTCPQCSITISDDAGHGTAVVDISGNIRYFASPGFTGTDQLTYTATDASGAWGQAQVTITVTPVARDDSAATNVGQPISVDVLANDDCTSCDLTVDSVSGSALAAPDAGHVLVTPDAGWSGQVVVGYTATDPSTGHHDSALLVVDVSDARPDSKAVAFGDGVTGLDVLANDTCNGCTVTDVTQPNAGTAGHGSTTVDWTPSNGFAGLATFGYTAGDGAAQSVASTVRILATPDVLQLHADAGQAMPLRVVPAENCPGCTVTVLTAPDHGDLDSDGTGGFTYTSVAHWNGQDAFDYRLTDPVSGLSVRSSVVVTVDPPQNPVPSFTVTPTGLPDPGAAPTAGQQVAWTWTLENTGDVTLTDFTLTTPADGSCATQPPASLAVTTSTTCTTIRTLTQDEIDAGSVAATAPFDAASSAGPAHAEGDSSVPLAHAASIALSAVAALRSASPDAPVVGDSIDLTYTVTNTGNTTVADVGLLLGSNGSLLCADSTLPPGAHTDCTGMHDVTQNDLDAGLYESAGSATASSPDGAGDLAADAQTATVLPHTSPPSESASTSMPPDPTSTSVDPTSPSADPTSSSADPTTTSADPTITSPDPTSTAPDRTSSSPSPTRTTPSPTPSPTNGTGGGTVTGLVWFDRNGDGAPDPGEWPLPAVTVRLEAVGSGATQASSARTFSPAQTFSGARTLSRAPSLGDSVRIKATDATGHYRFEHVAPGTYRVVASVKLAGFHYTSDSDGGDDWSVRVVVYRNRTTAARYAGLGKGTLSGTVYVAGNGAAVPHADVRCVWAGYDDTLGTADDVVIRAVADRNGRFIVRHVPYGIFSCTGRDPVTSRQSGAVRVGVHSAQPAQASLPVPSDDSGPSRHGTASTGTPILTLVRIALALAVAGLAVCWVGRRRVGQR